MKDLVIYKSIDEKGNLVLIKSLLDFEDFKDGIRVFSEPPYSEELSDKDCEDEYSVYLNNGIAVGCYFNNKFAGLNCISNTYDDNYGISFYDKNKVAYYAGLAVKSKYRKFGLGKLLVSETQKYLEELKVYDYCFARILCKNSMSEGIFLKNGFVDAYDNNKLIVDDVTYVRKNSNVLCTDKRKYMVKELNINGKGWYEKSR